MHYELLKSNVHYMLGFMSLQNIPVGDQYVQKIHNDIPFTTSRYSFYLVSEGIHTMI